MFKFDIVGMSQAVVQYVMILSVSRASNFPNLLAPRASGFRSLMSCPALSDKQSISTLEFESIAAVAMLNKALAGRNRSASDVGRFRLSSVKLRNHEVGYFDPLLWAVRVTIIVETVCIGDWWSNIV